MRYTIERISGYLKAEMVGRETAAETAEFTQAIVAAMQEQQLYRVLISLRSSRPVFKVEEWQLSKTLDLLMSTPDIHVAFIADTRELKMSQEYIALLGRQRGLAFLTFATEEAAVAWLVSAAE